MILANTKKTHTRQALTHARIHHAFSDTHAMVMCAALALNVTALIIIAAFRLRHYKIN